MSLDTVLKIGKALRNSNNGLKYFKYVSPLSVRKGKSLTSEGIPDFFCSVEKY